MSSKKAREKSGTITGSTKNIGNNSNNKDSIWKKVLVGGTAIIILCSIIYFFLGLETQSKKYYEEAGSKVDPTSVVGELIDGAELEQKYTPNADYIKGITIRFANYEHPVSGTINLTFRDSSDTVLASADLNASDLQNNADYYFNFGKYIHINKGEAASLHISVNGSQAGSAITVWCGAKQDGWDLSINGGEVQNTLYMIPDEYVDAPYTQMFWGFFGAVLILFIIFCLIEMKKEKNIKSTPANDFIHIFDRYKFLLSQLVSRDFKTKYRRSYLGIAWSLLNPLFMMMIVSAVFSFVFRFNIQHFQVYLILGQVIFNFFSEATQIGLTTIIGAGQLIKKVYMPKYIFPLSKTMYSFINFAISFIAVFLVMAFYRIPVTLNILYLPYLLFTYFVFVLGVSLFASAITVFFRDMQNLIPLGITALGYLTPIFYPADSLAPWMQNIMKLNPLYHYVTFIRTILLYGNAPSVRQLFICFLMAILSLVIGMRYFFKKQSKFILYI